jgi:nicotinamidase-related amidase
VLLDLQPSVLKAIPNSDELLARSAFLLRVAQLLEVPVVQSEQNPDGLGRTDARLQALLQKPARVEKTSFSAAASSAFMAALEATKRRQVVVSGIETHICVAQTLCELSDRGFETFACVDAIGARSADRHAAGLDRLRDAGVTVAHSESIVYEWLGDSTHLKFRDVLKIVKES